MVHTVYSDMPKTRKREREDKGFGPLVPCSCGCEATIRQFDQNGRIRRFVNGHYWRMMKKLYPEAFKKCV